MYIFCIKSLRALYFQNRSSLFHMRYWVSLLIQGFKCNVHSFLVMVIILINAEGINLQPVEGH